MNVAYRTAACLIATACLVGLLSVAPWHHHRVSESNSVVVVAGLQSERTASSVQPMDITSTPSSRNYAASATTPSYTEEVDLADIVAGPLAETRDGRWAPQNEDRLISGTKLVGIFNPGLTKATCGSSKCSLSVRTDGPQSAYNIEEALARLANIGRDTNESSSLTSNKIYSIKKRDGSTEFTVELLKANQTRKGFD